MAENPLVRKLKLIPGQRAAIIGAPEGYRASLEPLPEEVDLGERLDGEYDWLQLFVRTQAELAAILPEVWHALKPTGLLWIAFPKGSSKIQTDLTRDRGWDAVRQVDLKWINLVSVNEMWSAFSLRPYREGEERQTFR